MIYILYTIFFIACITLVGSVLLQPGKTDAGALFTSNVSNAAFGPRGTASVLSKITIVAATVFMLSALMISMPALNGNYSVVQAGDTAPATDAPATDAANANAAADLNSATAPVSDAEAANSAAAVPPASNTAAPALAVNSNPTANTAVKPAAKTPAAKK